MTRVIDGSCYLGILSSGIKNLDKHKTVLNELNVFPVPDGDTGTNMVMTLKSGFDAAERAGSSLCEIAGAFASSAVFGARGNSGVIISQFFKGIAEGLDGLDTADAKTFAGALEQGYKRAYSAVAKPVEGTMLTVFKDASGALSAKEDIDSVDDAVSVYLTEAKASLLRTPELLPILKKAGVVDSGASGVCYFFEGAKTFLSGESVDEPEADGEKVTAIDFSLFNVDTKFEYGYCVEGLIQLCKSPEFFNSDAFKTALSSVGDSIVVTLEGDKLKLHVHTKKLGDLMNICHKVGEFLTVKIENMTVQNMQNTAKSLVAEKFLCREEDEDCEFATVAVATTETLQRVFSDMGADVSILSDIAPSSQDFMDAFARVKAKDIIVFPNSSNSILSSMQAGGLYRNARVHVLNSRSSIECYSAMSTMDFSLPVDEALSFAKDAIADVLCIGIYHAVRDVQFGSRTIKQNDFFAMSDKKIISVKESLEAVTLDTFRYADGVGKKSFATIFYGENIADEYVGFLTEKVKEVSSDIEVSSMSTNETLYSLMIAFE